MASHVLLLRYACATFLQAQRVQQVQGKSGSSSSYSSSMTLQLEVHCALPGSSRQRMETKVITAQPLVSICQQLLQCHGACQQ
jgi:hypothetical protein